MRLRKVSWGGMAVAMLAAGVAGCAPQASKSGGGSIGAAPVKILNVSYDPTRELYEAYNKQFSDYWMKKTGQTVTVEQSNGGSGKQSQGVVNGLPADVVTLGISYDIDAIVKAGLIAPGWQEKLPNHSLPYTSTVVLLVRKGNPKGIKDWADLVKPGVQVITPNPKTSSGGRWNYVAAWGYALKTNGGNQAAARDFVSKLYKNVPVLDSGARGSTNTFVERGMGDALIAWENEALLAVNKLGKDKFEIVVPSISIVAEPPVAVVDKVAARKGTQEIAEGYLRHLYSPEGQKLIAHNYYRPFDRSAADPADLKLFPDVKTFTFASTFGTWQAVQDTHFKDGAIFDQIYRASR